MSQTEQQSAPTAPGDCYSAGERGWMQATQKLRGLLFAPLLKLLANLRVTPDLLTAASLVCGLAFCPLWFVNTWAALGALGLHVLLDGLDGPLARHLKVASRRGSFTDTMSDQCVVTAVTLTLMASGTVTVVAGGVYIFVYAVVVAFAMVRNALRVPYSWVIRPRFAVYLWLIVEITIWPGSTNGLLWICNFVLLMKVLSGFVRIRSRL